MIARSCWPAELGPEPYLLNAKAYLRSNFLPAVVARGPVKR